MPEFEFKTIGTVVHRSSSDWNLWIYLPWVEATLYKWAFSTSIQRPQRIRNWTIEKGMSLSVTEQLLTIVFWVLYSPFAILFTTSSGYGSIRNINSLLKERDRYSSENKRQFLLTTFNSAGTVFGLPSSSAALATLDRDARKVRKLIMIINRVSSQAYH